jgi:hypothetical protein
MEVPHRYPYNPPVSLILLLLGCGILGICLEWLSSQGHFPAGFNLWFGLIPIALAFIVGVHRISVDRYLLLDHDSIVLPIGPFTRRTAKIEYTSIRRVWRRYIRPYEVRFVLKVATEEQAFKILPAFLPDSESYRALEEFLNCKLIENTRNEVAKKLVSEKPRLRCRSEQT